MKFKFTELADDLPPDPEDWSPEDIMIRTPPLLTPEGKIKRALARFKFNVIKIQQLPVHQIQLVNFSCHQKMDQHVWSLAGIFSDALLFYGLDFDEDSIVVRSMGKRGRLTFISHEPLTGRVLLD